jgi:4-alpha-glucanotransferase
MRLPRASGILLHPTSLPGRFGIGDLGREAHAFLDALAETGQRWWQMLPLGPTGYGNSPYQSYSSYAGNPLLVSPEALADDGWLKADDWHDYPVLADDRVDFDAVHAAKDRLLRRAFERFRANHLGFEDFLHVHAHWLDDYALFQALKESHHGAPWYEWEPELVRREPAALREQRAALAESIRYYEFVQYAFDQQWKALRGACEAQGVRLVGDLPIFVAQDSADVWSRPDLFQLDEHGRPTAVAGVPPDYFSEDGQLWGNPLYKWDAHAAEHFAWWIARMKASTDRVDLVRLDHFRGFEAYWEVPAEAPTAAKGRWALGPGTAFLEALREGLDGLPLIAEDLGDITAEVEALRDRFNLPGMRILQFAFGTESTTEHHMPHRFVNHCIVYTGTHDNDTTVGWFTSQDVNTVQSAEDIEAERKFALRYLGTDGSEIHWEMIRLALASVADTAIVPLQDVLGLNGKARMNVPGRAEGNWAWRFRAEQLDAQARHRLADMTAVFSRWNGTPPPEYRRSRKSVVESTAPTAGRDEDGTPKMGGLRTPL